MDEIRKLMHIVLLICYYLLLNEIKNSLYFFGSHQNKEFEFKLTETNLWVALWDQKNQKIQKL